MLNCIGVAFKSEYAGAILTEHASKHSLNVVMLVNSARKLGRGQPSGETSCALGLNAQDASSPRVDGLQYVKS